MKILTAYSRYIIMKKKLYQQPQTESFAFQMATSLCLDVSAGGSSTEPEPHTGMPRRGTVIP